MKHSNLWKLIAVCWYGLLLTTICVLFWYKERAYPVPTPIPSGYTNVNPGEIVNLPAYYRSTKNKPVFLHFFNPDCSCSRFNIAHFRSLVNRYGSQINFSVVVISNKIYTVENIQEKFGIDIPVRFDTGLARICGVYSTPQAVIIKPDNSLYYRGNYNKNTYSTNRKTNYAELALSNLLYGRSIQSPYQFSVRAHGCPLPSCAGKLYVKR